MREPLRPAHGGLDRSAPPADDTRVRGPGPRLRALAAPYDWRTALVVAMNAGAAAEVLVAVGLARAGVLAVPPPTLLAVAGTWALLALWGAVRRRLTEGEALAQLCGATGMLVVEAVLVRDPTWQWVCAVVLSLVPVTGIVFRRGPRLAPLTAVVVAGQVVIAFHRDEGAALGLFSVSALVLASLVPVVIIGVLARAVRAMQAETALQARTDVLTGLLNRRGMGEAAGALLSGAARRAEVVGVVLADVDGFKAVNDTWGHAVGDEVLVATASALREDVRAGDLVVRLGGEELAVIGAWKDDHAVAAAAERLRAAVEQQRAPGLPPVTVSIGTATAPAGEVAGAEETEGGSASDVLSRLIDRADQALYEAKRAGRNCVRHSSGAAGAPSQRGAPGPRIGA
ncbi:GGDEF domain-containing protein [Quadrisphaera setariae]|uniref:GGDEF domain-containing protein n=1 Tax=Quadrisphaera setariae TaxID=2593304 RepID=A0A5C8ZJE2_9ACTN|nr:GGDEF domain-containing protein [Quadrisphaera setariae]